MRWALGLALLFAVCAPCVAGAQSLAVADSRIHPVHYQVSYETQRTQGAALEETGRGFVQGGRTASRTLLVALLFGAGILLSRRPRRISELERHPA